MIEVFLHAKMCQQNGSRTCMRIWEGEVGWRTTGSEEEGREDRGGRKQRSGMECRDEAKWG